MAKKTKPAKPASRAGRKAAPKKVTKKAVARSASSKKKKAAPKRTVVKKAAPKKAVAKAVSRKAKKPAAKKVVAKKKVVRKAVAKKLPAKKIVAVKVVVKPAPRPVEKKAALVKMPQPAVPLPPVEEGLETLVGKAANISTGSNQMMVPGDGLNEAPLITEDPVKTFDKNVFNKATANGIPQRNLQFSSKPKNAVKPSGKKPLW